MPNSDTRATPIRREQLKLSNQSTVLASLEFGEKLTVSEITRRVNRNLESDGNLPLAERTIRRAIDSLKRQGFLRTFGRSRGSTLFGRIDTSYASSEANEPIVSFGGELVTVEDFLQMLTDMQNDPLKKKLSLLSVKKSLFLRRLMTFVIMSSGEAGYNDRVNACKKQMLEVIDDLEHTLNVLQSFANSSVWYDVYRDRIAGELRSVQERNPDLFALAVNFVKDQGE